MTQREDVSYCCWENGASSHALYGLPQIFSLKSAASAKCSEAYSLAWSHYIKALKYCLAHNRHAA